VVTPKLYKASEVCELAQLQPYVLRSWEKEFPGIGIQKSPETPRLYRQSDVDQVLRIKQLVFAEGLTMAGVRRRLEEGAPSSGVSRAEAAEVFDVLGVEARRKIASVRDGLRGIHSLLSNGPGAIRLEPPLAPKRGSAAAAPLRVAARRKTSAKRAAVGKQVAPSKRANAKRRANA
jgi:DNA-binding transcriptional MerR regulator